VLFLQIIVYNFVTIYGITTKFGIRMRLYSFSVYQISRELDNAFVFYNNFHTLMKSRRKKEKNKNQETKPIFKGSYLENIMCGDDIGWHSHCKNRLFSVKCHGATYT